MNAEVFARLKGRLIVSCQDYEEVMIPVAIDNGAAGLRLNGPQAVRFARGRGAIPILACHKMYFPNSEVYITPSLRAAASLVEAGADLVALDARALPRRVKARRKSWPCSTPAAAWRWPTSPRWRKAWKPGSKART